MTFTLKAADAKALVGKARSEKTKQIEVFADEALEKIQETIKNDAVNGKIRCTYDVREGCYVIGGWDNVTSNVITRIGQILKRNDFKVKTGRNGELHFSVNIKW